MRKKLLLAGLVIGSFALGVTQCGGEDLLVGQTPETPHVVEEGPTTKSETFALDSSRSHLEVTGRHTMGAGATGRPRLTGLSGKVLLHVANDGSIVIDDLSLKVPDQQIAGTEGISGGITVLGIRVVAEHLVLPSKWDHDKSYAQASGIVKVQLEWALDKSDGSVGPLAPVRIRDAQMTVELTRRADDTAELALRLSKDGTFWTFTNLAELSDAAAEWIFTDQPQDEAVDAPPYIGTIEEMTPPTRETDLGTRDALN